MSAGDIVMDANRPNERERRIRSRNIALGLVLFALVVLFYVIAIVRLGGG